jgi:hypothetical protein
MLISLHILINHIFFPYIRQRTEPERERERDCSVAIAIVHAPNHFAHVTLPSPHKDTDQIDGGGQSSVQSVQLYESTT